MSCWYRCPPTVALKAYHCFLNRHSRHISCLLSCNCREPRGMLYNLFTPSVWCQCTFVDHKWHRKHITHWYAIIFFTLTESFLLTHEKNDDRGKTYWIMHVTLAVLYARLLKLMCAGQGSSVPTGIKMQHHNSWKQNKLSSQCCTDTRQSIMKSVSLFVLQTDLKLHWSKMT